MKYSQVNCRGDRFVSTDQMPIVIFESFVEKKDAKRIDVSKLIDKYSNFSQNK